VRAVERKGGDRHLEALAALRLHLVAPDHDAGGRRERGAARILEALARLQHRLLADDAGAAHLLDPAERVGDPPVPAKELHGLAAVILDPHLVRPDVMIVAGRGLVLEIDRLHRHLDGASRFRIHADLPEDLALLPRSLS
jgi:hypothetical protein